MPVTTAAGRALRAATAFILAVSCSPAAADPADEAAAYLLRIQQPDGFYAYEYDFLRGRWSLDNNLVRQAGTAYALATYHRQRPDPAVKASVESVLQALSEHSMEHADGLLVSIDGTADEAKTGATALALAAATLLESEALSRDAWLRGLLALQRDDGRFQRRPNDPQPAGYYDGEAWLALAHVAAIDGTAGIAEALSRADTGMMAAYGGRADITFFHWGALASAARIAVTGDERLAAFAAEQAAGFLDRLRPYPATDGSSCYQLEGLAAAYLILKDRPQHDELSMRIGERIATEFLHNLDLQIRPGQVRIVPRPGVEVAIPELPEFAGAFLDGRFRLETRVDTTQHCLAALLQLADLGVDISID